MLDTLLHRKEKYHLGEEIGPGLRLRTWAEMGLYAHCNLADVNISAMQMRKKICSVLSRPVTRTQWEAAKGCGAAGKRKIHFIWSWTEQDIHQTSSREASKNTALRSWDKRPKSCWENPRPSAYSLCQENVGWELDS